jgi:immune inhibitor A
VLIAISVACLTAVAVTPAAAREPVQDRVNQKHNLPSPLSERQAGMKSTALEMVLQGQATPRGKNKVVKLAPGQFVELAFEGEDQILTLLAQFGEGDPAHHGGHVGDAFSHNSIPEPDRTVDNSTIWVEDFSQEHYDTLLYSKGARPSMANYYLAQSSGAYSVDGYVSDWLTVPNNPSGYGSNYCGGIVCADTWRFVNDQADAWWSALVAEQGSVAAANAFIATFDIWDRYDSNGNGNFNEPDGYIDHFQSVHAGEGEETGGGALGSDAIWSHRWYAYYPGSGLSPDGGEGSGPNGFGGLRIGESNYWIGDYTVEPENGGVGVFAHEFAHDLGLPDLYDTSGNTGGAENSTGWWTIMSQGSYGSINGEDIGSYPTDFGAWEKFQLGFLRNFDVGSAGVKDTFRLGPAEFNNRQAQAAFIILPDKEVPLGPAFAGDHFYWSGSGAGLDNTMTKTVTLPASGDLELNAQVRYDIETNWDYAYLTVDGDGVATNRSTNTNPNGQNFGHGITGSTNDAWVALTADLSAYAGDTVEIGFRYWTDPFVNEAGFMVDALEIPGQPPDGAEADAGWTFDGFVVASGDDVRFFFNAYVLENRQYIDYDLALREGPYNFGFPDRPNYVEHFPLQDGLLISYWDSYYDNNNVGDHPGEGLLLPVDSHPAIETWSDGTQMRPRIQSYDSTFTLARTDGITLHNPADGVAKTIASKPGNRLFNDGLRDSDGTSIYWTPSHPSDAPGTSRYQSEWNSVNVPDTGTTVEIKSLSRTGIMVIDINK